MRVLTAFEPPASPARTRDPERAPLRVGVVQQRFHPDPVENRRALSEGVRIAAGHGARLVCLQELTLSPYFASTPDGLTSGEVVPEDLVTGPTYRFAAEHAERFGIHVHASLFERVDGEKRGYNTAIVVAADGSVACRTRKLHIPVTRGYHEDRYFLPGRRGAAPSPYCHWMMRASASRPAGTNGSRKSPVGTRSPMPMCWSLRRPSARSPAIPTSTPSRSGSR